MRFLFTRLLGGRLQLVLVASFSLIAALTVGLDTVVSSWVINEYLASAEDERVARDSNLAEAFYRLKLDEMAAISHRLRLDPWVIDSLPDAAQGQSHAIDLIDQQITNKITVLALDGTHFIALLDPQGRIVVGRVLLPRGKLSEAITDGDWSRLPIVEEVLSSGRDLVATEIIPAGFLHAVGLAEHASIQLVDTPLAAPQPFDPLEGTAGLALVGVSPVRDTEGQVTGAAVSVYLLNNDFTLVDRIKEVAGIDTVTIFFGDLRVSTNVMTADGQRAVGTRISDAVGQVVLRQAREYVGRAYVVKEWFITRYEPLYDHRNEVVGSLYVGARESAFLSLVHAFNNQVSLIALVCILLAAIIAVPIARAVAHPIVELVQANRRLADGDMSVRVHPYGGGELAILGRSFNTMVETLHRTQQGLLHKEKLASVGQLAAGVAHEINNPLATILLLADVLQEEAPESDPRRNDLKMIIKETSRCKEIVASLLNFARQQEVLARDTDIHHVLDEVLQALGRQPHFQELQVQRQFSPDVPIIQADPSQLKQVFINLVSNAGEAIDGVGTITIATRRSGSDWVEIAISDTGCGIPEANLDKLFTPFFTTKAPGNGTGLGLSIVYGIVKMHRGQISVQSQEGKGTTFTITLPVAVVRGAVETDGSEAEVIG